MASLPDQPRITTVIPTYRRPEKLKSAIRSALEQRFERIRVSVFDNASGDETEAVVRELAERDRRITYNAHAENIGLRGNYNFGMGEVRTEFFSFLADDDRLRPDFYLEAVRSLDRHPEAVFFASRTLIENESVGVKQLVGESWRPGFYEPSVETTLHMIREHFIGTGCVFRTSILSSVGFFGQMASDRNYLILASTMHPFVVGDVVGVEFSIRPESFSGGGVTDESLPLVFGVRYVLGLHEELETTLRRSGTLTDAIQRAIVKRYHRDLWWTVLTRAIPQNRVDEIEDVLENSRKYLLSRTETVLMRVCRIMMRIPGVARVAGAIISGLHWGILKLREPNGRVLSRDGGVRSDD